MWKIARITNVAPENVQTFNYTYSADWMDKLDSYDGWSFTWEQRRIEVGNR